MIDLLLMRHAKSDWGTFTADIDRPLNARGRRDAEAMGMLLQQREIIPQRMVVSAAQRTRETADQLLKYLPLNRDSVIIDRDLYLADRETLCEIIELYTSGSARSGQRLLILAHNPGMDDAVQYLSASRPPLSGNGKLMTTSAVAYFQLASSDAVSKPGQGQLINLFRPKEIEAVAGS